MAHNEGHVFILYGSQTGQAEAIAECIDDATSEHDIKSTMICLEKAEEAFKIVSDGSDPVIFVCSTTGDGEPPEHARKFVRMLQKKALPESYLSKLRYALLGLGDSNYSTFCGGPKTLERILKKFGAKPFYPTGFADDGTDLEMVVEPWIEGLWPALKSHLLKTDGPEITAELPLDGAVKTLRNKFENIVLDVIENNRKKAPPNITKLSTMLPMNAKSVLRKKLSNCDSEVALSPAMQPYLSCEYLDTEFVKDGQACPDTPYPLSVDKKFFVAPVRSAVKMTREDAIKTALCVTLDVPPEFEYIPGDSFGVVVPNPDAEVDWLLQRLGLEETGDKTLRLTVRSDTKKKNAKVPNYVPKTSSARHILKHCLEIRSVPKRTFLRVLFDFTTADSDKKILRYLSSKEGMLHFVKHIREPYLNILDVLAALTSCHPPLETLVEHLPRLKARLYSAASCSESSPGNLRFVFNIVHFPPTEGRMYERKGLCTGSIEDMISNNDITPLTNGNSDVADGHGDVANGHSDGDNDSADSGVVDGDGSNGVDGVLEVKEHKLIIFRTKNVSFTPPADPSVPLVMVGPGTGVAPFIGFLEHLRYRRQQGSDSTEAWLFYGCRHKERDHLFREDLQSFLDDKTLTKLVVAFSRDDPPLGGGKEPHPKYVQDNLRLHAKDVRDLLLRKNAVLYVCGDARHMAKDVKQAIKDIYSEEIGVDAATDLVQRFVLKGRYKEDVWT